MRGLRLVTAGGELLDVDERQSDLLQAAQGSVGMLGVFVHLKLDEHFSQIRRELDPKCVFLNRHLRELFA